MLALTNTHDVKHPGDAVTDMISYLVLKFPATVIKILSTVTLQALTVSLRVVTKEDSSGGTVNRNLHYNAAVPFFDHSTLQQTLVTPLYLLLPQRPSDRCEDRTAKEEKTWSRKDTGDGQGGSTELLRSLPPGVTLDLGLRLSHLE